MNTARIRALIILAIILLLVGSGLWWLFNNSFITVNIANAENKELTYSFTNQKSNKTVSVVTSEKTIKKRLPRGSYKVQVSQADSSLIIITSAPGIMRTATVGGELSAERARSFVGNNPSPCMFYGDILFSFACGSTLQKVNAHVPATASRPTYVTQPFKNLYASFEDTVTTKNGTFYILVRNPAIEDVQEESQAVYALNADGTLSQPFILQGIPAQNSNYKIKPYKDGFVVYDLQFSNILYYPSPGSTPTVIKVDKPKNTNLTGFALETSSDAIIVAYSTLDKDNVNDTGNSVKAKNEVVIYRDGKTTHSTLNSVGSVLDFCGTDKLCALAGTSVDVYELNKDKPRFIYSFKDVQSMNITESSALLTQTNQVVSFNVDTRQGYVAYSMGGYTACGQQASGDNLLLCLINNKSQKVALLLDMSQPVTDQIDKQVFDLQKQAEVTSVSAYKNFISVAPNYGRVVYDRTTNTNGYDPAVVRVVNNKILDKVKELGINTNTYTVNGLLTN